MVPLGPNATASEFVASANGIGHYWLVLNQNPSVNYEAIDVLYLAGMQMSNAADRKSTRLNSSHSQISYAVFCLKKKTQPEYVYLPSPHVDIATFDIAFVHIHIS